MGATLTIELSCCWTFGPIGTFWYNWYFLIQYVLFGSIGTFWFNWYFFGSIGFQLTEEEEKQEYKVGFS